jgi:hypothetical protein
MRFLTGPNDGDSRLRRSAGRTLRLGCAGLMLISVLAVPQSVSAVNDQPARVLPQNRQARFLIPGTDCIVAYRYGNYSGRGYSSVLGENANCGRVTTKATNFSNGTPFAAIVSGYSGQWVNAVPAAGTIVHDFCVGGIIIGPGGLSLATVRFAYNAFTGQLTTSSGPLGDC